MYTLILVLGSAYMGTYADLPSCQNAIHKIYEMKINPYHIQNPEIKKAIDLTVSLQREYVCIPKTKDKR